MQPLQNRFKTGVEKGERWPLRGIPQSKVVDIAKALTKSGVPNGATIARSLLDVVPARAILWAVLTSHWNMKNVRLRLSWRTVVQ